MKLIHTNANKWYVKNFNKNKESSYITYVDKNNLLGFAMSQKLPTVEFEWVKTDNIDEDFI